MQRKIIEDIIKELENMDETGLRFVLNQIKYLNKSSWPNFGYPIDLPNLPCDLKPRLLTYEQFSEYTPEKIEFIDGLMFGDWHDIKNMSKLMLYQMGLEEIVKLAPKNLWEKALGTLDNE